MLTDAHCRNATCPPDKKRGRLSDSGGLYLEVTPNGSKRWFWKYRHAGKEGRLAIGNYPAVKLPAARKARDDAKRDKEAGTDPVKARQVARAHEHMCTHTHFSCESVYPSVYASIHSEHKLSSSDNTFFISIFKTSIGGRNL